MRRLAVLLLAMAGVLGSPGAVGATRFDAYSVNWAGYYVNRPANQFVTQVSATVVAPT